MSGKKPPTLGQLLAWEEAGRADHRAGVSCPRYSKRSRPEVICRARGWLQEAAKLMPGGWAREIPPMPPTDSEEKSPEGFRR